MRHQRYLIANDAPQRRPRLNEYSHIHGRPSICQVINRSSKKVGIAAIHPDFRAAMPLSLMEYAGRIP
jgi:hypothetical protein